MPPVLAAVLTTLFAISLLMWDSRRYAPVSGALWLPVLWMAITASRFLSQWMNLGASDLGGYTEGSPVDALYFLILILAGLVVLARRRIVLARLIRQNAWFIGFFLFCLLSVTWSDDPFTAFKRWFKTLGHPIMALIILTDPDPPKALGVVLRRCAYFLLPFSVLFIKYYPEYGRGFDAWTGTPFNRGVGLSKNDLGYTCMVLGLYFFWQLLTPRKKPRNSFERRAEIGLCVIFLGMIAWLFQMADSATSLVGLVLGAATLAIVGLKIVNRRFIGSFVVLVVIVAGVVQLLFDPYARVIELLGRNPTLTDRTAVWADVLALQPNVLIGTGFESFWLGPRLEALWAKWWWKPNQAHNGYIETYLNLGLIGLFILLGLLVSTFRKISKKLTTDFDFARLRLALLLAIIAFNYTEAAFKGVHFVWTIFCIIALDYAKAGAVEQRRLSVAEGSRGVSPQRLKDVNATSRESTPLHRPRLR